MSSIGANHVRIISERGRLVQTREDLEARLNDFDPSRRREALEGLLGLVERRLIELPEPVPAVNLHSHTFFSYNGYGYSPTAFAWKARLAGLAVAGVIDFDVLDAVEEFLEAAALLGLKGVAGIETRVFVPEFATREINSPGEPGICYHIGYGFTDARTNHPDTLAGLKTSAQTRNRIILERVNRHLAPLEIDYDRDVLPLTPNGNATERHLCMAYDARARELFPDEEKRALFWSEKLGTAPAQTRAAFADPAGFQGMIRAKTMKRGGAGYVKPEGPDFPRLDTVNAFILDAGAIPTYGWLDGTSAGERDIDELLYVHVAAGAAAINIIPDRNWNIADPETRKTKVENLYAIVGKAHDHNLPIFVGTEMNAPGQRFVDDFSALELKPLLGDFLEGAHILYAHTVLQRSGGLGYLSDWARRRFPSAATKNAFYARVGESLRPGQAESWDLPDDPDPATILSRLEK